MTDIHDETREQVEVKVCFLPTLSVWVLVASVPLYIVYGIVQNKTIASFVLVLFFLCLISAPLMATVSLIRISLSGGRLKGGRRACAVLIGTTAERGCRPAPKVFSALSTIIPLRAKGEDSMIIISSRLLNIV